ncbi:MAG: autotransporter-associated beta strand repeat-containing protein, partial [Methylobacteriaceae bacterium]|nr:autotransporter-associated beta strand repeat-containing protein [Methylobacteriaceae bacterium]
MTRSLGQEPQAMSTLDLNGQDVTLPDGTIFTTTYLTGSNDVTNNGGADATLTEGGGGADNIYSGFISDGTTNKTAITQSSGFVDLTDANTYSGGTNLQGGEIGLGNASALGTGALTMAGGTTLQADAAGLFISNAIGLGGIETVDTTGYSLTLSGTISGGGSLTKIGTGTLTLSFSNTYSGGTYVNAGVLKLGSVTALGSTSGALDVNAGTLDLGGFSATVGAVTLENGGLIENGRLAATSYTLSGGTVIAVLAGAGGVTVNGGTVTLFGANTYDGGTNLVSGTLDVANSNALGNTSGGLTMADQTTLSAEAQWLTIANDISLAGGTEIFDIRATLSGVISGTGALSLTGMGFLTLSGTNTYSGGTLVNDLSGVSITSDANLGAASGGLTLGSAGTIGGLVFGASINLSSSRAVTLIGGGGDFNTGSFSTAISSVISGDGRLYKDGSGTLTLSGANTYSGGTYFPIGTIAIGHNDVLGTGSLFMGAGTTLDFGSGNYALGNDIFLSGFDTITIGQSATLSGVLSGDGSLVKTRGGQLSLTQANTYSGGTNLDAGSIFVSASGALGSGTLNMADATTLRSGNADVTLANAIVLTGFHPVDVDTDELTLSGAISGTGSLDLVGAGTLTLSHSNAYSGGTTLTNGTLALADNNAPGTGSLIMRAGTTLMAGGGSLNIGNDVALNGSDTINDGNSVFTLSGVISGTGAPGTDTLNKVGTGTLELAAANTYSGVTVLSAGTIMIDTATALGTSKLAMSNGTTLRAGAAELTVGTAIFLSGIETVDTNGDNLTLSGVISDSGSLTKIGAGTLILTGDDSYLGGTIVNAGTLQLGAVGGLPWHTSLIVNASGTFDVHGADTVLQDFSGSGNVLLGGGVLVAGSAANDT